MYVYKFTTDNPRKPCSVGLQRLLGSLLLRFGRYHRARMRAA
jgi:hypothetical protein